MKLNKLCVLPMFIFSLTIFAFAQDEDSRNLIKDDPEYITMPVNVSWFPGFSMGESMSRGRKIINLFSLNILAGRAARLTGVEFGYLWNAYTEDIRGFQACGGVNTVDGKGQGIQLAGVFNGIKGHFRGFQSAGIINIAGNRFNGFQAAGVGNYIENASQGIQMPFC